MADALSRCPTSKPDLTDVQDAAATTFHVRAVQTACVEGVEYTLPEEKLHDAASADTQYQALTTTIVKCFAISNMQLDPSVAEF